MKDQETTTLNSLLATTIDSANGFEEAARMASASGLATQFAELARDRWEVVETLEDEIRQMGSEPKRSGTAKAAAHRRWLDLKNTIAGSDRAVIQEVENGETYLRTKYEAALAETDLSETARRAIEFAFASISRGRERVRGLGLTIGTTEEARHSNRDWRRIGKGLGIAAAIGGAAFAASRLRQSRRTDSNLGRRRSTTLSIDRTDRTEIEARNAESTTPRTAGSMAAAGSSGSLSSDMDSDLSTARSAKRSGGSRSAGSRSVGTGSASVGLAASGSTGGDTGTTGAGFAAGSDDMSSGLGDTGNTGSFGSTGGTGGDFNRS